MMKHKSSDHKLWSGLFFKLLPYQVLLLIVDAANGIVDSICASNFIGQNAMNAIGLYSPLNHFLFAMSIMLVGGSQLMVGKAMGMNKTDSVEGFFSTDLILSVVLSGAVSLLLILAAATDAARIMIQDPAARQAMNSYLTGQAFGIPALVLGQQLFSFLSMENQRRRTMAAGIVCMIVNSLMDILLVYVFKMGTFGLGLASALGLWSFCVVMLQYYVSGRSSMKFSLRSFDLKKSIKIFRQGYTGAISRFLEMFRCIIVNALILRYTGAAGMSAFAAVNSVMAVFWPITFGMMAVTRMLLSITIGEEDRKSIADIMRVVLRQGLLFQCGISALIILLSGPFTNMFYHDPSASVYGMTVMGFRLLPLCMPLAVLSLAFVCYSQATEKKFLAILLPVLDGAVDVVLFALILIPVLKLNGLYIANILNGIVCAIVIFGYSAWKNRHFPRSMEELLLIPDKIGVGEEDRIDLEIREQSAEGYSVGELTQVTDISGRVIDFCSSHGIDSRRSFFAGLALEEMAGNVVEHGFEKDRKKNTIDIRVVHKDEDVILRVLDNCQAFDPFKRMEQVEASEITDNVGIRLVHDIVKDAQYQNLLGLNVLTLRI